MLPTRAEALGIELPNADVRLARLCERLPGHLAVWCEGHCEFGAAGRGRIKRLTVEKCRLYVARSHRLPGKGGARIVDQNDHCQ